MKSFARRSNTYSMPSFCLLGGIGGSDSEAASVWMAVVQVRGEKRREEEGRGRKERAAVWCRFDLI
jgi:hypothetical protein